MSIKISKTNHMKFKKLFLGLLVIIGMHHMSYSQCAVTAQQKDVTCKGGNNGEIELTFDGWNCDYPTPTGCVSQTLPPENYCTKYSNATGSNVTVNTGQGLCLPSGFNGSVNINGGTIVACGTVTISSINFNGGTLIVMGNATIPNVNANNSASKVYNYGTITSQNFTFSGAFYNNGRFTLQNDLNINANTTLENTGTITCAHSFNNNGTLINKDSITVVTGDFKNNGGAVFSNFCTLIVGKNSTGQFHNNNIIRNYGYIYSYNLSTINSGSTLYMYSNSVFENKNIQNTDGVITGINATCCQFKVTGIATFNSNSRLIGPMGVCGVTLSSLPTGVVGANITSGCTCVKPYIPVTWTGNGIVLVPKTQKITGLKAGTYTYEAACGGCTVNKTIVITEPSQILTPGVASSSQNICNSKTPTPLSCTPPTGGDGTISYQWQKSTDNVTFTDISSATNSTYSPALPTQTTYYRCKQSIGICGNVFTNAVSISLMSKDLLVGFTTNDQTKDKNDGWADAFLNKSVAASYLWSNGETTPRITATPNIAYWVTITDIDGCQASKSVTISEIIPPVVCAAKNLSLTFETKDATIGVANGEATAILNGDRTIQKSYLWNTGASSQTITNLAPQVVSVTVTDQFGCPKSGSTTIFATIPPGCTSRTVGFDVTNPRGTMNNGTVTASIQEATPVSFLWSNGETTATISGLGPQTLKVTVTDDQQCPSIGTTTLFVDNCQDPDAYLTFSSVDEVTPGNNGSVSVYVNNAKPISYLWSNGAITSEVRGLKAQIMTVTVTTDDYCTLTGRVRVGGIICPNNELVFNVKKQDEDNYSQNGWAEVIVESGIATQFAWSNGGTTAKIEGLSAGLYKVTVTNSNGCKLYGKVSVDRNITGFCSSKNLIVDYFKTDETAALNDGMISIMLKGAYAKSYAWSNGKTTSQITQLQPGTYTVTITDYEDCPVTKPITIKPFIGPPIVECQSKQLQLIFQKTDVTAKGADGTAFAQLKDNIIASYVWSNGAKTQDISNLVAGTYDVTVTDAGTCTISGSITILDLIPPDKVTPICKNKSLVASIDVVNASYGASDGEATAILHNGAVAKSFEWHNGTTTQTIKNMPPSVVWVTITDVDNCPIYVTKIIGEEPIGDHVTCSNDGVNVEIHASIGATVSATALVRGATASAFVWNNGATTPVATGFTLPGIVSVNVTYGNSCHKMKEIFVPKPPCVSSTLNAYIQKQNASGNNNNGYASVIVTGGIATSYLWNTGSTTPSISNLAPQPIYVVVTDNLGCIAIATSEIGVDPLCTSTVDGFLKFSSKSVSSAGNDGSATVELKDVRAVSYAWSNNKTTKNITGLTPNTYSVTVIGDNNCPYSGDVVVPTNSNPCSTSTFDAYISVQDETYSQSNGKADVVIIEGTATSYLWNNGGTNQSIDGLKAQVVSVTVTSSSCSSILTATIRNIPPNEDPTVVQFCSERTIDASINIGSVTGVNNGSAEVDVLGSTSLTYLWSTGATTKSVTNVPSGPISVTVTYDGMCVKSIDDFIPTENNPSLCASKNLAAKIYKTDATNGSNGTANAWLEGSSATSFMWTTGATTQYISGLKPQRLTVRITDAQSCKARKIVYIFDDRQMILTASATNANCRYLGSVQLQVTGGYKPYSFLWTGPSITEQNKKNQNPNKLAAGNYRVTVTDNMKRTQTADVYVSAQTPSLSLWANNIVPAKASAATGQISLGVSGGMGYAYRWSNGATTKDVKNLKAGVYSVTITDYATYCTATNSFTVPAQATPNECANFKVEATIRPGTCEAPNSACVDFIITGGRNYHKPMTTNPSNVNLKPGSYNYGFYEMVDGNYCSYTVPVTVVAPAPCNNQTPCNFDDFEITSTDVSCSGGADGSVQVLTGDADANKYTIQTNFGGLSATNLVVGQYTAKIILKSDPSCYTTLRANIGAPIPFNVSGDIKICPGEVAEIKSRDYDVTWSGTGIEFSDSRKMQTTKPGTYYATKVSAISCSDNVKTITIAENNLCPDFNLCEPIKPKTDDYKQPTCTQNYENIAKATAQRVFTEYIQGIRQDFKNNYIAKCLASSEKLSMTSSKREYHNTLYYYDQAGNLIKTVPPAGVTRLSDDQIDDVANDRANKTNTIKPDHSYPSVYTFNSLNQLTGQNIPDHDPIKNQFVNLQTASAGNSSVSINGVEVTDNNTGVLCGVDNQGNGVVYTSTPVGSDWTLANTTTKENLHAVQYLTPTIIVAAGNNGTFVKSTDGGVVWQNIPTGFTANFKFVFFENNDGNGNSRTDYGYIVDENAIVYSTEDGGVSWKKLYRLKIPSVAKLVDISFASASLWYIAFNIGIEGKIYASNDQGFSSYPVLDNNVSPVNINDICPVSATTYYAVGDYGTLVRSVDACKTWSYVKVPFAGNITSVYFFNESRGFVRLEDRTFKKTTDGGVTWTDLLPAKASSIVSWDCDNSGNALFLASSELFVSSDFADHFTTRTISGVQKISAASLLEDCIIAASNKGALYLSSALTQNVFKQIKNTATSVTITGPVKKIIINDQTNCLVMMETGVTYSLTIATDNQGNMTYTAQPVAVSGPNMVAITTPVFTTIAKLSTSTIYGKITLNNYYVTSTDAGVSWTALNLYPPSLPVVFDKFNVQSFEIDKTNATIYRRNLVDLSRATTTVNTLPADPISSICNVNHPTEGLKFAVCGPNGNIIQREQTGVFRKQHTPTTNTLNDITFIDDKYHAVGNNKTHLVSTSSSSWIALASFAPSNILGIAPCGAAILEVGDRYAYPSLPTATYDFNMLEAISVSADFNVAFAVGNNGSIMKFENSTWSPVKVTLKPLNDISQSHGSVYAVGQSGTIIKSSDACKTWSLVSNETSDFTAVGFGTADVGVVAGNVATDATGKVTGAVKYTVDGAQTFTSSSFDAAYTAGNATKIVFVDPSKAFMTTAAGYLFASTDAGKTWKQEFSTTQALTAFAYPSSSVQYVAGKGGLLFKKTSTGWVQVTIDAPLAITEDIVAISFPDEFRGYVFTASGKTFTTNDGGEKWTQDSKLSSGKQTNDLAVIDDYTFVAGGNASSVSNVHDDPGLYTSVFWYDELGRQVISQNAEQFKNNNNAAKRYSYTRYDQLGRNVEVGEATSLNKPYFSQRVASQVSRDNFELWINPATNTGITFAQVTRTQYDYANEGVSIPGFEQDNLRKRIASVFYYPSGTASAYTSATHYSYDIHGNVKTLVQDIPSLGDNDRYKRIDYTYDLVSNKVTELVYQKGKTDQFAHRYAYDEDNRLVAVETSTDLVLWNKEANYKYYEHGPLARVEIGDSLQGIDYVYNLQGWIKGVNSPTLADGAPTKETDGAFLKDEFGFGLAYFNETKTANGTTTSLIDYKPIASEIGSEYTNLPANNLTSSPAITTGTSLYNGNISAMVTSIAEFGTKKTNAMSYRYDQLNRITASSTRTFASTPSTWGQNNFYDESFTYDPNGNIKSLIRNAPINNVKVEIDKLSYSYYSKNDQYGRLSNRLRQVTDAATPTAIPEDMENQTENYNYEYDANGNLKKDVSEGISGISWTVSGKISEVKRSDKSIPDLKFEYDAMGNRIAKHVIPKMHGQPIYSTYYIRDVQGQILATYSQQGMVPVLDEQHIYGSSRLGMYRPGSQTGLVRGNRIYECSNHLGNVLVTLSDRVSVGSDSKPKATITTANDYYAFGMGTINRGYSADNASYRFGFNGKEKENKISLGNYDFGARIYDGKIGRWLSIDPFYSKFASWSPYNFAIDNPINFVDPDGGIPVAVAAAIPFVVAYLGGAYIDYSFQVGANIWNNPQAGIKANYTNVNLTSMAWSGTASSLTLGASNIPVLLSSSRTVTAAVTKATVKAAIPGIIGFGESAAKQHYAEKTEVSLVKCASDALVVSTVGIVLDNLPLPNTSDVVEASVPRALVREADMRTRISLGDPISTGRQATAAQLNERVAAAERSAATAATAQRAKITFGNELVGETSENATQNAADGLRTPSGNSSSKPSFIQFNTLIPLPKAIPSQTDNAR